MTELWLGSLVGVINMFGKDGTLLLQTDSVGLNIFEAGYYFPQH